jgi:hypothetical protein
MVEIRTRLFDFEQNLEVPSAKSVKVLPDS